MKIFVPRVVVASLQPPQTALMPKFGGLPWGFPVERWPVCRDCMGSMVLLAQLPHNAAAGLGLGDDVHVLHLFQCPTAGCSSSAYDAGCTASLILRCEELGDGLTEPPAGPPAPNPHVAISRTLETGEKVVERFKPPTMYGELWITGWDEYEDGVCADERDVYFDDYLLLDADEDKQEPFRKLQAYEDEGFRFYTKAGGFPYWRSFGANPPEGPFEFLLQVYPYLYVRGALPKPEEIGCDVLLTSVLETYDEAADLRVPPDKRRANAPWGARQAPTDGGFCVQFAILGPDSATAYVFIDRAHWPPRVTWAWSR